MKYLKAFVLYSVILWSALFLLIQLVIGGVLPIMWSETIPPAWLLLATPPLLVLTSLFLAGWVLGRMLKSELPFSVRRLSVSAAMLNVLAYVLYVFLKRGELPSLFLLVLATLIFIIVSVVGGGVGMRSGRTK